MIYILLLTLCILTIIGLLFSNFNIISPFVISCIVYLISVFFIILNRDNWSIEITSKTTLIIISALIIFGLGEILSNNFWGKRRRNRGIIFSNEKINISPKVNICILIFSITILILYYFRIREIAIQVGYKSGQNLMIQYARLGILNMGISIGYLLAIGTFILRSLAYIYTFIYIYNKVIYTKSKKLEDIYLLIPIICYLIQYSLGGSRGGLIEYISYALSMWYILKVKSNKNKIKNNINIIKGGILALIIFFVVFAILGVIKGSKANEIKSTLSLYTGGSILALDKFLMGPRNISSIFGKESLIGINNILYMLNIYPEESSRVLEFINIGNGYSTNIYTALRRYINDFGYLGMLIIQFLLGFIMNFLTLIVTKIKRISYLDILYPTLFMILVYQSIDEQFLVSLFSTTQIFTVSITYILYKVLLSREIKKSIIIYKY